MCQQILLAMMERVKGSSLEAWCNHFRVIKFEEFSFEMNGNDRAIRRVG